EACQMPLQGRVPNFGFKSRNRGEYTAINLDSLHDLVAKHKLRVIAFDTFKTHSLAFKTDNVNVLCPRELTAKDEVKAHAFSASAQKAIEAAGGSIVKI